MIRRLTISYTLVYLNDKPLWAIIIHLITSTLYVVYLIKTKPFIKAHSTRFEIITETFICIGAMYFMLYCNDAYEIDSKTDIGWFYLGFNSISLLYILKILITDFIFNELPEYIVSYKNTKKKTMRYCFKRRWMKMKR